MILSTAMVMLQKDPFFFCPYFPLLHEFCYFGEMSKFALLKVWNGLIFCVQTNLIAYIGANSILGAVTRIFSSLLLPAMHSKNGIFRVSLNSTYYVYDR